MVWCKRPEDAQLLRRVSSGPGMGAETRETPQPAPGSLSGQHRTPGLEGSSNSALGMSARRPREAVLGAEPRPLGPHSSAFHCGVECHHTTVACGHDILLPLMGIQHFLLSKTKFSPLFCLIWGAQPP